MMSLFYQQIHSQHQRNLCYSEYSCEYADFNCRFENLSVSLSSYENNMLKISQPNTIYFLRYVHMRYVKSLFTNIQIQKNLLKMSLLLKKLTNFR